MQEPASQAHSLEAETADRIATALESIAQSFAVIAMAMLREDDASPAEPKRDPLRTMDDPPIPSANGLHA